MKTITLFMDHHQNNLDGTVTIHKAGETVDLPEDVADYIAKSVVDTRAQIREQAAGLPWTPEGIKAEAAPPA